MVTSTFTTDSESVRTDGSRSLGYDFALLGLQARESRVEVIRLAAQSTASRIHEAAIDIRDQDSMLSDLVASTYRLLDPRQRSKMMERVQLCILSEADLESQSGSRKTLVSAQTRLVLAELVDEAVDAASKPELVAHDHYPDGVTDRTDVKSFSPFQSSRVGKITYGLFAALTAGVVTLAVVSTV